MTQPDSHGTAARPLAPHAPPEPGWRAAESRLSARLAEIEDAAADGVKDTLGAVATRVSQLVDAIREAAEAHAELCDSIPSNAKPVPDRELWQHVCAYRSAAADAVLRGVHETLDTASLGRAIGAVWLELIEALAGLTEGVEETVVLPEGPDLFAPAPEDSTARLVKKWWVRRRRGFGRAGVSLENGMRRLLGRELRELRAIGRLAPVRQVLEYHLVHRLPVQVASEHEAQQRAVAAYVAPLERAFMTWSNEIHDLEVRLDRPGFHDPGVAILPVRTSDEPVEARRSSVSPELDELPGAGEDLEAAVGRAETKDPGSAERPGGGALVDLQRIADSLQRSLMEAIETGLDQPPTDQEAWTTAWSEARDDLERCGTLLLTPSRRRVSPNAVSTPERVRSRQMLWTEWHAHCANRLGLARSLISLRGHFLAEHAALLRRVADATLAPVHSAFEASKETIGAARVEAEQAFDSCVSSASIPDLRKTLEAIQHRTVREMQRCVRGLAGTISLSDQTLSEIGEVEWERLCQLASALPERVVVHAIRSPTKDRDTPALLSERQVTIELREMAQIALSPSWPSLLADGAEPLRRQIVHVWGGTEHIHGILQYNFGAAVDELAAGGPEDAETLDWGEELKKTPEEIISSAHELAADALRRSSETLDELLAMLRGPWSQLSEAVFTTVRGDWDDLVKQVRAEGLIEERLVEARTQLARWTRKTRLRGVELGAIGLSRWARAWKAVRDRIQALIRHGRSAVGVVDAADTAPLDALEMLTTTKALREKLPLVYRRLFTLMPLTEPTLLEGRAGDLARVRSHLTGWRRGIYPGAIALTGPLGSGRTSLLHALREKVFDGCDVRQLALGDRIEHESDLAEVLAQALGVELEAGTLGELEEHILAAPRSEAPVVVTIDDFEHLLMQVPGGGHLIERALIFFSRMDTRVLWIVAVGGESWEFVRKTAAGAASCVTTYELSTVDRATVEKIIANRHGRSGMTLRFRGPVEPSPILKQRLRRAKTDEKKQRLLSDAYFDALYRESGESVMLALYYWLRSVEVDPEADRVEVNPLEPVDFRFLATLDLTHALTLKAFLLHYSLTLDEHRRIFRMSREQSTYIFEALLSLRIIEPSRAEEPRNTDGGQGELLVPDRRYRIKPLVLHPVSELLRSRHILY